MFACRATLVPIAPSIPPRTFLTFSACSRSTAGATPVDADDDGVARARQHFADTFLEVGLNVPRDSGVAVHDFLDGGQHRDLVHRGVHADPVHRSRRPPPHRPQTPVRCRVRGCLTPGIVIQFLAGQLAERGTSSELDVPGAVSQCIRKSRSLKERQQGLSSRGAATRPTTPVFRNARVAQTRAGARSAAVLPRTSV